MPRGNGAHVLDPGELARYADAVVHGCLALREGETLFVQGEPPHRELMVALAESAYRAGAELVDVHYVDRRAQAARIRHARDEHLGPVLPWTERQCRAHLAERSAVVTVLGEADPGVFDGLPPERVAQDTLRRLEQMRWYVRAVEAGRRRWAGVAWPTEVWASRVYPELETIEAQRRLAEDLLWFSRLGPGDPPGWEGWTRHVEAIVRRADALTALDLARLELRAPGTALDLRLAPGTRWLGGQDPIPDGRLIAQNIPTEENYTSPDPAGTEGSFRCSRPLSFQGRLIEGITGEFRRGRLVRLDADREDDRDLLAAFIDAAPNGARLGEVALVDASSRIGQAERIYRDTLLDENAAAHIAFGFGFGQSRDRANGRSAPVNKSNIHVDVMIGTEELEATGLTRGGDRIPLIRDGVWQI